MTDWLDRAEALSYWIALMSDPTKTYFFIFGALTIVGGIIGGTIAFELARRNLCVAVLDRQGLMQESSWAAAGIGSERGLGLGTPVALRSLPTAPAGGW